MGIMHSEWKDRINHWIRTLKADFYQPLEEMQWSAFRTMEHMKPERAGMEEFESVEKGFIWGETYEYCWFKTKIVLPKEAEGKRIVLQLNPGGESTLFVNGKAFGTYRASWVREPHHFTVDNSLTECAKSGEEFELLMETYGGHFFPEIPEGGVATGPILPGTYEDPAVEGERRTLEECTFGVWNEEAYQLYMDVTTLESLLSVIDMDSLRAEKIASGLEQFTITVDFEQDREKRILDYQKARKLLAPLLEAENGSTAPIFYGIGNAHLDLAWLWPMAETHRKTARTFAAQLRLIKEYPEYKFIQSQPASYVMCREHYPELYAEIKEAVKKGQWIADGAMWVEPDTNMAGGEALIRQLVHGKRFYKEEFDVDSEVLWLPDTFGYTGALPQILKGCGVKYLVTQKIFWSYNEGDQFPYHYFTWRGMDGTEVVSFLPTSYTYNTAPSDLNTTWKNRVQKRDLEGFLLPFGYGDGGGGPTRDHVEFALRQKNLEGGVKVKMEGPKEFFAVMERQGGPQNTYVGELYFSAHRGVYTSQASIKENNRRGELALREMEMWGVLAQRKGYIYPLEKADILWKELLLNQFHDILPGSSIARVYEESDTALKNLRAEAGEIAAAADAVLEQKEGLTFFNSLSFDRTQVVTLPAEFALGAATAEGVELASEVLENEVKAVLTIPACGAVSVKPVEKQKKLEAEAAVKITEEKDGFILENGIIRVFVNRKGNVTSFIRKESQREFAAGEMNQFLLYKDVPRIFDAWDIDSNYLEQKIDAETVLGIIILKSGDLEGVIKVWGTISKSKFVQYISLKAMAGRVEFKTEIDWRELHRLLKVGFPVKVYAENGINEMQFGFVERPLHRSRAYDKDRFEVCNHRYSAICDGSHGAAVLNESKYGISMNENALELTLLRAAASPEMRSDNRVHCFNYAFTAWEGSFTECDVVKQGYEMNLEPLVRKGGLAAFRAMEIEKENVILEACKPAEDGSANMILRLYEAKKAAGKCKVTFYFPVKQIYLCDMLENREEELAVTDGRIELDFRAFQVITLRVV